MSGNIHTHTRTRARMHSDKGHKVQRKLGFSVWLGDSHKKQDPCVGHCISQSQDPTAHYGITEVKDGHAKRSLSLELQQEDNRGCHLSSQTEIT